MQRQSNPCPPPPTPVPVAAPVSSAADAKRIVPGPARADWFRIPILVYSIARGEAVANSPLPFSTQNDRANGVGGQ